MVDVATVLCCGVLRTGVHFGLRIYWTVHTAKPTFVSGKELGSKGRWANSEWHTETDWSFKSRKYRYSDDILYSTLFFTRNTLPYWTNGIV